MRNIFIKFCLEQPEIKDHLIFFLVSNTNNERSLWVQYVLKLYPRGQCYNTLIFFNEIVEKI